MAPEVETEFFPAAGASSPRVHEDPFLRRSLLVYGAWTLLSVLLVGATILIGWQWQATLREKTVTRAEQRALNDLGRVSDLLRVMLQIHARDLIPLASSSALRQPDVLRLHEHVHPYLGKLSCAPFQAPLHFRLRGCVAKKGSHLSYSTACHLGRPKIRADGFLGIPIQAENPQTGDACSAELLFRSPPMQDSVQFTLYAGAEALSTWQRGSWGPPSAMPNWRSAEIPVVATPWTLQVSWPPKLPPHIQETLARLRWGTAVIVVAEILLALLLLFWLYRRDMNLRFRWVQEQLRAQMLEDSSLPQLFQRMVELSVHTTRAHAAYVAIPDGGDKFLRVLAICGANDELREALRRLPLPLDETISPWGQLFPVLAFLRRQRVDRHSPHVSGVWAQACAQYPALRGLREVIVWPLLQGPAHPPLGVFALEIPRLQRRLFGKELIERWDQIADDLERFARSRREAEEQYRLLHFDPLTNLPNRQHFLRLAEQALGERTNPWLAILDLDYFNELNTIHGDGETDRCLAEIAREIRQALPADALLGRIGGDEFAIVLDVAQTPAAASREIAAAIARAGHRILGSHLTASFGWAQSAENTVQVAELFHQASEALAQAKLDGRNAWREYEGFVRNRAARRLHVHRYFARAIEASELAFFLQPKGDLLQQRINGCEMLVRWRKPEGGWLGPGKFMPYVEENPRLIRALGRYALREACRLRQEVERRGLDDWSISLNIGARHFLAPEFIADLQEVCPNGQGLILELTETSGIVGRGPIRPVMERCRELGYRLSMDDFGTGYSSLLSVAQLPFDELKLDQRFIRQFRHELAKFSVAGAAQLLSRLAGMHLVAEGIAVPEELRLWHAMGGRYLQGYLLAPPLPEAAFFDWYPWLMPSLLHGTPPVALRDLDILWEQQQQWV
ncbi:GGDEF domain-containing protein [Acidithiobacillus sp. CV18-2]|uniref:putative bifunctional diguanylate cyclase/phosphodiesterase n=1 Tax=Igneacidithiobacillus copahuensis TaxID=2724909 RepID=UPI001C0690FA|nr:bifunctional diguanylate cyclase/phosphodiesterase [Igneacidithiobacillus copahuensis]MBU2753235.1 GGDEF domain-containing protein [Acidithiobacillus sp. CV18-3]MBU2757929.1 GGDEF domain-containing protein [Acidithiobacillus sp. BN09-2]MBU2777738.1 GGDEF domain-containing protein [Acidithiobacillus sp. CV18-2]MBU2796777.1 GGDEF domain-containing protein [Acidithiobacillus sp. VAN18-2]MBU2800463.1 GGDEF domain-containing protein [Acidithiobacillus sp. VAN18-4]UTV80270.1 bifunctional diguany